MSELYNFDFTLQEEEILLNNNNNQIMENSITYGIPCNFCNCFGHTISYCFHACSLGQNLHLKGIEIKNLDIELNSSGNNVKSWIENLTFMEIIVLSNRINLKAYSNSLWERGMINEDTSLLNIREDYNITLRYFYYYEPIGINLKYKIHIEVCILETEEKNKLYHCPICINDKIEFSSILHLNCSHNVCTTCFENYLIHNHFNKEKKPICSLCRCLIKKVKCSKKNNNINNLKSLWDSVI